MKYLKMPRLFFLIILTLSIVAEVNSQNPVVIFSKNSSVFYQLNSSSVFYTLLTNQYNDTFIFYKDSLKSSLFKKLLNERKCKYSPPENYCILDSMKLNELVNRNGLYYYGVCYDSNLNIHADFVGDSIIITGFNKSEEYYRYSYYQKNVKKVKFQVKESDIHFYKDPNSLRFVFVGRICISYFKKESKYEIEYTDCIDISEIYHFH